MKKDIEWLKENIGELPCVDTVFNSDGSSYMDSAVQVMAVYDLINQLDDPEVLSLEWISENAVVGQYPDGMGHVVPAYKLQNLLVPMQPFGNSEELPVVPKYIADWIEGYNWKLAKWKLPSTFRSDVKYKKDQRLYEWSNKKGNMYIFMKAILLGYEVEKEPKYVIDLDDEEISDGNHYLKRLEMSADDVNIIAGDSSNAMAFESEEEAQLIAEYVGGRVEELEE